MCRHVENKAITSGYGKLLTTRVAAARVLAAGRVAGADHRGVDVPVIPARALFVRCAVKSKWLEW
jgi:hypothetical protein